MVLRIDMRCEEYIGVVFVIPPCRSALSRHCVLSAPFIASFLLFIRCRRLFLHLHLNTVFMRRRLQLLRLLLSCVDDAAAFAASDAVAAVLDTAAAFAGVLAGAF